MKALVYIVFGLLMSGLGYHLYGAEMERRVAAAELAKAASELEALEKENQRFADDIDYYSDPHNLEKELRSRFNYRAPNEKLIIVVPEDNH
ncbi:MAG: hypothetical protein A3B23_03400 [Candidatus Colwellbacteria bacterium RIFCSPLOWO2_01_FULL_48_10]|uniref:Septum formation initiator n=1 Tax=Candidatus Colwellbacteria bacterium RIFCSPLOWO2_01_FULL_48_10 TaxID=1797690 RepID=A0A1G1Z4X6_9BACT|nr:MAG: hypothetical protein A3B23_03400 [Candidatus Colwellbacteria bacterium RIFCSPLOWO2_01_FULL_48_10]